MKQYWFRWVWTLALLVVIWLHAHWSVALFATLTAVRFEIQDVGGF